MCNCGEITRCSEWKTEEHRLESIRGLFSSKRKVCSLENRQGPAGPNHRCQAASPDQKPKRQARSGGGWQSWQQAS
ncbi:hypothetical protein GGTG_10246 [Gaeumannomyces tritici R3-111a-1]|uniref:Uncharacterized protein n=1 Tax=Gaeumannomyces tritici (strain R3-111a-1) TaxID=644352 RepID=J3P9S1_GAET3|nr:hypothetical protein GGTG_10246 [Gaeumannomyces tritici R3-111a-1]EJT73407.1 hypothetical protein GGTG_10246 [Gaeumannomyces tritici R3-111a-1]